MLLNIGGMPPQKLRVERASAKAQSEASVKVLSSEEDDDKEDDTNASYDRGKKQAGETVDLYQNGDSSSSEEEEDDDDEEVKGVDSEKQ
jgi:hypothetical protein